MRIRGPKYTRPCSVYDTADTGLILTARAWCRWDSPLTKLAISAKLHVDRRYYHIPHYYHIPNKCACRMAQGRRGPGGGHFLPYWLYNAMLHTHTHYTHYYHKRTHVHVHTLTSLSLMYTLSHHCHSITFTHSLHHLHSLGHVLVSHHTTNSTQETRLARE